MFLLHIHVQGQVVVIRIYILNFSVQPFEIIIASSFYKEGKKKPTSWQHNEKVTKVLETALEYSLKVQVWHYWSLMKQEQFYNI